jgi:hypothetical protein
LLNAGRFALEEDRDLIAMLIRWFLKRRVVVPAENTGRL